MRIGIADPGTGTVRSERGLRRILETDAAQSLYIEAAMAVRLGQIDEAKASIAEAASLVEGAPNAPEWWKPQTKVVQAEISTIVAEYDEAETLLREAIAEQRQLFTESRSEGLALLALGRLYAEQERNEEAFTAYRAAFPIIEAQGSGLHFHELLPFFEAAMEEAAADPARRDRLYAEMFEVGQLVRGGATVVERRAGRHADPPTSGCADPARPAERGVQPRPGRRDGVGGRTGRDRGGTRRAERRHPRDRAAGPGGLAGL